MLTTLFKRRSDGGVQEWTIEVEGSKYRTVSGIKDGKMVISEWTQCLGKNAGKSNETSSEAQALLEAQAIWRQKVEQEKYTTVVEDVDAANTFSPMLAHTYDPKKIHFPIYSQRKIDGVRCIARKEGLFSRNGKPILSVSHIFEALKPYFDANPKMVFDGELYCGKLSNDFNKIISLCRKSKPTQADIEESAKYIQYWVYDLPSCQHGFGDRYEAIKRLDLQYPIIPLEATFVTDQDQLDALFAQYLEEGFEGQILRETEGMYECKRSMNLLKRKEFLDDEFTIIDVEEGIGNRSGMAGKLVIQLRDGTQCRSGIAGGEVFYRELWLNRHKYNGKKATIKYFGMTPDGMLRFPVCKAVRDYE